MFYYFSPSKALPGAEDFSRNKLITQNRNLRSEVKRISKEVNTLTWNHRIAQKLKDVNAHLQEDVTYLRSAQTNLRKTIRKHVLNEA
jgi:hypothetical protein